MIAGRLVRFISAAFALVGLLTLVSSVPQAEPAGAAIPPVPIEIKAHALDGFDAGDLSRRRFGQLEFRSGLELTSAYKQFGGISAIRLAPDGDTFLALSDHGWWLRGRIMYDGARMIGISHAEMAPMLGANGRPLTGRGSADTESLTQDGGAVYVGVERANQILKFDFGRHGLGARGHPIPVPPGVKQLPHNKGLEALVHVPKGLPSGGTLLAISERGLDAAGHITGFMIGGPSPGTFGIVRSDDFDITDAAVLPSGDLLVLERRFSLLRGVAMRIRRIPLASITPGAVVDGPVLIDADMGYQIDNMEGLSVHVGADGRTVLTIVSDDNFSMLQRTLLLQFTLVE